MARKPASPRPTCRECSSIVEPSKAAWIDPFQPGKEPLWGDNEALPGLYCDSDCLLDAYIRGFPMSVLNTKKPPW